MKIYGPIESRNADSDNMLFHEDNISAQKAITVELNNFLSDKQQHREAIQ